MFWKKKLIMFITFNETWICTKSFTMHKCSTLSFQSSQECLLLRKKQSKFTGEVDVKCESTTETSVEDEDVNSSLIN